MALTKIDDRGLTTPIDLLDSEKIRFGTGNDLEIYHVADGNSFINDTATAGQFIIQAVNGHDIKHSNGELAIRTLVDGSTSLYHDGSKKLETHTTGVVITGNISPDNLYLGDNEKAYFGDGSDLQIYHESDVNYILVSGKETQIVGGSGNNKKLISTNTSNAVELYHDNNKKLETTSTGISITGDINATSAADVRLTLGSSGTAGTNNSVHVRADSANLNFMAASGGVTKFEVNGTETFRITSDGNVGIGTGNPRGSDTYKGLELNGTTGGVITFSDDDVEKWNVYGQAGNFGVYDRVNSRYNLKCLDDGNVELPTGNLKFINGKGIDFSATGDGSGASNVSELLDDYEVGTFTPSLSNGTSDTPTYSSQLGGYVKIGKKVYFQLYLIITGATGNGSHLKFGGLPFTSLNSTAYGYGGAFVTYQISMFDKGEDLSFHIGINDTQIKVYDSTGTKVDGNSSVVNDLTTHIAFSGFYLTA